MNLDVLYLARNRQRFTEETLDNLLLQTDWSLVRNLVLVDDGSEDGTREHLEAMQFGLKQWGWAEAHDVDVLVAQTEYGSPVGVMQHYLSEFAPHTGADVFAKIDNDVMVPPLWLQSMLAVWGSVETDLLGMEAGRNGIPTSDDCERRYEPGTHIGGVGLMRVAAFRERPRLVGKGRFGFTEWQHRYRPARGWVTPDLRVFDIGRLPMEPWLSLSAEYEEKGWARHWEPYDAQWCEPYWRWWA